MPIVKCVNCDGRLHRTKPPTGSYEDINKVKHPRYYHYKCDKCDQLWRRDVYRNLLERERE